MNMYWMHFILNFILIWNCILWCSYAQRGAKPDEPYYGTFLGALPDPQKIGVKGDVYVVNMTTIQVIGFKYNGRVSGVYFWFDKSDSLTERGYKVITFEFGDQALKQIEKDRIVLWSSPEKDGTVKDFQSFGLWNEIQKKNYGSVYIPSTLRLPSVQFLTDELRPTDAGRRYNVYSGPIMIMDVRRLKIFGFIFDTVRAPKTHFYVGRGLEPKKQNGVPVPIRGLESPNYAPAIQQAYTGDQDVILELPSDYDIYHIEWISVFCSQFNIDFGHVKINPETIAKTIPPYVPLQRKFDQKESPPKKPWPLNVLSGKKRRQFVFQLGPPGFDRSYGKWAHAEPARWLWYVNGYMTPQIWLQRGITYTFIVEGGDRPNEYGQFNALYITNSSIGAYGVQADYEKEGTLIFAGLKHGKPLNDQSGRSFGRNCTWLPRGEATLNPEEFDSFLAFKKNLRLKCENGPQGSFQWKVEKSIPNTVYYQSYAASYMGFEMIIVDDIPTDLLDSVDLHEINDISESNGYSMEVEDTVDEEDDLDEHVDEFGEESRPGSGRRNSKSGKGPSKHTNGANNHETNAGVNKKNHLYLKNILIFLTCMSSHFIFSLLIFSIMR